MAETSKLKKYQEEDLAIQNAAIDTQKGVMAAGNQEYLNSFNEGVDKKAAATAAAYQEKINQAPVASRALYDANAIDEAIAAKKIQESMANMGLTDSGLTRSMVTANAMQKARADAGVRRQEREYVQQLESIIAQTMADAEATKMSEAARVNKELTDWYAGARANAAATASANATSRINNENTIAWEQEEQIRKQENDAYLADINDRSKRAESAAQFVQNLIANGVDPAEARAEADKLYRLTETQKKSNFVVAMKEASGLGYSADEAAVYADFGGGKTGVTFANIYKQAGGGTAGNRAVATAEIKAAGVDISELTKFKSGSVIDWMISEKLARESAAKWDQDDWNAAVGSMVEEATENVAACGLSDATAKYAIAEAVGSKMRESVNKNEIAAMAYTALKQYFSGDLLVKAATAAGTTA